MYKKDFILRIIEEIAKMIAKMLGLLKEGKYEEVEAMAGRTLRDFFQLDIETIDVITKENIVNFLSEQKMDIPRLNIIAELLYVRAEALYAGNSLGSAKVNYEKAMEIYMHVEKEEKHTFSLDRKSKIESIVKRISEI